MRIRVVNEVEALSIINRMEGHDFDKKSSQISGAGLQKIAVAFSNADGGEIAIGIEDEKTGQPDKNRWNGKETIEDYNALIQNIVDLNPSSNYVVEFLTCVNFNGIVLYITIDRTSVVNKTSDGTVYIRKGAQSLPIKDPEKIQQLAFSKGASSFEDWVINAATMEHLVESAAIKEFCSQQTHAVDPIAFVINQGLVDFKTWDPKAAGVLLFSDNPSGLIPKQCSIKIARYQTREDDPERDHLEFTETIEGCLYNQINQSVTRIKEILSDITIWTTEGLRNISYPHEAVWELVVNAVIHRDYSISDNILISIFNDRVEIKSPGKLPGFVTVDNIRDARFSRNKNIVRIMNKYIPPPNRDMGEGINTAFQKMKDWKLKDPYFKEELNYFIAILPHASLAEPETLVLDFLNNNGTITNRQARDLTGIRSENSVKNIFYRLRDTNKIERVPGLDGNKATWRLKA